MTTKRKAPRQQGSSQPEMILTLETSKPTINRKKIPTSYRTQKPFMRWWEDTLDHHWPYEVPANLTPDKQRIWKLAEIGHALRTIERNNEN